jgi:hypothetical protein
VATYLPAAGALIYDSSAQAALQLWPLLLFVCFASCNTFAVLDERINPDLAVDSSSSYRLTGCTKIRTHNICTLRSLLGQQIRTESWMQVSQHRALERLLPHPMLAGELDCAQFCMAHICQTALKSPQAPASDAYAEN